MSNRGLLTVDTLHEQGGELTLFDGKNPVSASAMELIRESDHVYKVVLKNGITHTITKDHKVMTTNGLLECGDLSIGDSVVLQGEKGLFGETHEPIKAYQCGFECEDVPSFVWVGDEETQSAYFRGIVDSGTPLNEIHEGAKTVFRNLGVSGFNEGSSEIVDIIYMGEEPVYCCEVFTDDHLWTVNGVVTHNCEIALPSKPMQHIDDVLNSEIFLCTLANVNMTAIKSNDHLRRVCRNVVRYLDGLLDFQNYPVAAAEFWGKNRRSLGVGVNNYAHWLARKGLSYGEKEANEATHEWFEAFQYYLILASMELAKEKGACGSFHETKYARGIMPVDAYKKDVDELGDFTYHMDWDWLREQVKEHGMRNSTLTAIPPSETSSTVLPGNSTNGVEMPRNTMVAKTNKDVSGKVLVPEVSKLKNRYSYLWDQESPEGYIKAIAVMQKFIDQAISSNTSYNPDMYEGGDIPMSRMMRDMLLAYKYGLKTLYYNNTKKAASTRKDEEKQALVDEEKERQQHEDDDDEECESCAI